MTFDSRAHIHIYIYSTQLNDRHSIYEQFMFMWLLRPVCGRRAVAALDLKYVALIIRFNTVCVLNSLISQFFQFSYPLSGPSFYITSGLFFFSLLLPLLLLLIHSTNKNDKRSSIFAVNWKQIYSFVCTWFYHLSINWKRKLAHV